MIKTLKRLLTSAPATSGVRYSTTIFNDHQVVQTVPPVDDITHRQQFDKFLAAVVFLEERGIHQQKPLIKVPATRPSWE